MKKPVFGASKVAPVAPSAPTITRETKGTIPPNNTTALYKGADNTPLESKPVIFTGKATHSMVDVAAPLINRDLVKAVAASYVKPELETPVLSKALQAAHEARRQRALNGETLARKNPVEKLACKPTSLRLAINAKCFVCQGEDQDVGVRQRIGTCTVVKCPLHAVRPYQRNEEDDDE